MIKSSVELGEMLVSCPPDPERIIKGLRDTGYNFNTAIADIIDNSIAAHAKNVVVTIDMDPTGEIKVYIVDNGDGMDKAGLINAMTYGSKVRTDLGSLGKFGLGLKTGSTAFCRSLSVISRDDTLEINKAQWDLDYVTETHDWNLKLQQATRDEIDLLNEVSAGKSGTVVVWRKVDRLLKSYSNLSNAKNALRKKINDLQFHVSMVYQRFLDKYDLRANDVEIVINGTKIEAWDPFAKNEPQTELLADEVVEVDMPDGKNAELSLKAYVLPNKDCFSTPQAAKNARLGNDMQGFFVYRENRLIHYGDWLDLFSKEPHGTLLRVEFSFDHNLDEAFNVDIKKSRILPAEEILEYIKTSFIPAPRRVAQEKYRHGTAKRVQDAANQSDAHAASNRNIDEKASSVEGAKITVTNTNEAQIVNQNGTFKHTIKVISNPKPGQVRVITKPSLEYGQLWEPCIADGKHAVQINQSHPYYQKVYSPILEQNVMVTGMDALLWALAEAEHKTYNEEIKEQYEEIRIAVSRILKTLVADLPDPEGEDEV